VTWKEMMVVIAPENAKARRCRYRRYSDRR